MLKFGIHFVMFAIYYPANLTLILIITDFLFVGNYYYFVAYFDYSYY